MRAGSDRVDGWTGFCTVLLTDFHMQWMSEGVNMNTSPAHRLTPCINYRHAPILISDAVETLQY